MSQPHSIYEYMTKQLRKYIMKGWSLKILKIKLRKVLFLYQKKTFTANSTKKKVSEAAVQRCSYEKVFWKYAANLQENTHAKVWFQ